MNDRYLQLSIEELILDDAFIRDARDRNALQEWAKAQGEAGTHIKDALVLMDSMKFTEEQVAPSETVWKRVEQSTETQIHELPAEQNRRYWIPVMGLVAASLALLLVFSPFSKPNVVENMGLADMTEKLPAGSVVTLSQGSQLTYNKNGWDKKRKLELNGTAEFDVTEGVPFSVSGEHGSVRVIGTKFKVDASETSLIVSVSEGIVEVSTDNNKKQLTQGMGYLYNPIYHHLKTIDNTKGSRTYEYDEAPLKQVIQGLEAEYGVTIENQRAAKELKFTGFFSSGDMNKALQSIFWPLDIKYELEADTVTLSR